jgi:hypothetical protein
MRTNPAEQEKIKGFRDGLIRGFPGNDLPEAGGYLTLEDYKEDIASSCKGRKENFGRPNNKLK